MDTILNEKKSVAEKPVVGAGAASLLPPRTDEDEYDEDDYEYDYEDDDQ